MDHELIESNMRKYHENFKSDDFQTQIVYASKAFLAHAMCQLVVKCDLDIDAVSGGVLCTVKVSGLDMKRVPMPGNNKTLGELVMCVDYGIGRIIIDNDAEIEALSFVCAQQK